MLLLSHFSDSLTGFQVKERRLHVPLVDRLPEEAPPIVVAVVGPPGVRPSLLEVGITDPS